MSITRRPITCQAFPRSQNVMILDNDRLRTANRLIVPPNVHLVFLPPYSPALNPVERVWQHLKDALGTAFALKVKYLKRSPERSGAPRNCRARPTGTFVNRLVRLSDHVTPLASPYPCSSRSFFISS